MIREKRKRFRGTTGKFIPSKLQRVTKKIQTLSKQVRRNKAEIKYVDGVLASTALTSLAATDATWAGCELNPSQSTTTYGCLPVPRQGSNYADRDGKKIRIQKIRISGTLEMSTQAITGGIKIPYARIVIAQDMRTNGTQLQAETVMGPGLGSDGNAVTTKSAAINALSNPNEWGRYKILFSKYYRFQNNTTYYTGAANVRHGGNIPFKITIKPDIEVNFSSSTGAVGSVLDNSFHVFAAVSEAAPVVYCSYTARTSFTG